MLPSFVDESVQRPEVQALIRKVDVREAEVPPIGPREWAFAYAVLDVDAGGQVFRERVDIPRGDCRNPLTDADVDLKFIRAVEFSRSGWDAKALLEEIRAIPSRAKLDGFRNITA